MLGLIGGTGLYKLEGLENIRKLKVDTPFGAPSGEITFGELNGVPLAFLPRHGENHQLMPSEINFRANIYALKSVGVRQIVGISAIGSLREKIKPGDLVAVDQYIDWTRGKRANTFFGKGLVAHISTAKPSCTRLSKLIVESGHSNKTQIHPQATYICVEGPRLGTQAESLMLQKMGADVVGMTNVPEAFLAREAQICYCTIGVATDYDCWLDDPSMHVSAEQAMALYRNNIGKVRALVDFIAAHTTGNNECECRKSLRHAVVTPLEQLNTDSQQLLEVLKM